MKGRPGIVRIPAMPSAAILPASGHAWTRREEGTMHKHGVDRQAPHQVMRIAGLRAHPLRMVVVFGTPVAFAATGLLQLFGLFPWPRSAIAIYTRLRDQATLWIAIHVVQLLLILLLAVAVYWLTEGLTGTAARLSRVALLPYLVFYSAFDSIAGLGRGLVALYGSQLPAARQAVLPGVTGAFSATWHPVPLMIDLIGSLSWAVAVVAAAVALRHAGAPWTATIPLGLAGLIGAYDHAAPYGPVAMALFLIAAYVLSRPRKPLVLQPGRA